MIRTWGRALLVCLAVTACDEKPASTRSAKTTSSECEHGLTPEVCPKCTPALAAVYRAKGDWCAEHGFPESFCPICNPGAKPSIDSNRGDWCPEHGLPESKCTKCNPDLIVAFKAAGDWCASHGFPESACPICNRAPGAAVPSAIEPGTTIRFRSGAIESATGLRTEPARDAAIGVGVESTAQLAFDRNRVADIRAPFAGVVRDVLVDLGEPVKAGAPMFRLESAKIGALQGQVRSARQRVEVAKADFERLEALRRSDIASARQHDLARQELEAAEAELRALGSGLRIAGASNKGGQGRFVVRSPRDGVVVRRPATVGTFATEEISLATVADTAELWALLQVRELDASDVRDGQQVELEVDGLPDRTFSGTVTWVSPEVDPHTRTVAVRAQVTNTDGQLRANQFARATVRVASERSAVTVPRGAVQRLNEEQVVFVHTGDQTYEPRVVTRGRSTKDRVQVIGDVRAGERVVTDGAYLLKTELSKDQIGAGCCEVEGPK